jgi:hypothetical protein
MLIPRTGPVIFARERLAGSTVDEAAAMVKQTRKALDEKR